MLWNNHNLKILEKDDKEAVGIFILYFFRTWLNEAYIVNVSFANPARTFLCFPEFYFYYKNI